MPSPIPEPTRLKKIKGNPSKRPMNENEPEPDLGIPEPPIELKPRALKEWYVFAKIINDMGIMTIGDGHALARMCECYALILECEEVIREKGMVTEFITRDGNLLRRAQPEVAVLSDADKKFKGYLQEFGLTPSSRSKIQVPSGKTKKDDPINRFFN